MTLHRALNPKTYVARLYLSRKEGGRGVVSVEDTVKLAILVFEWYVLTSEEGLLIAARTMDGDSGLGMTSPAQIKKKEA